MLARVRNDNLCASPCGSTESISARAVGRLTRSPRRGSWRGRHSMRRQRKSGGPMTRRTTGMPMSLRADTVQALGEAGASTLKVSALPAQKRSHSQRTARESTPPRRTWTRKGVAAKSRMQGAACSLSRGSLVGRVLMARGGFHGFDRLSTLEQGESSAQTPRVVENSLFFLVFGWIKPL
jgi:hypothetical protein